MVSTLTVPPDFVLTSSAKRSMPLPIACCGVAPCASFSVVTCANTCDADASDNAIPAASTALSIAFLRFIVTPPLEKPAS